MDTVAVVIIRQTVPGVDKLVVFKDSKVLLFLDPENSLDIGGNIIYPEMTLAQSVVKYILPYVLGGGKYMDDIITFCERNNCLEEFNSLYKTSSVV